MIILLMKMLRLHPGHAAVAGVLNNQSLLKRLAPDKMLFRNNPLLSACIYYADVTVIPQPDIFYNCIVLLSFTIFSVHTGLCLRCR